MIWLYLLLFLFTYTENSGAQTCAAGEHWVRAHHRRAYYRADGTLFSATNVSAHCRFNSKSFEFWNLKFSNERPSDWPHAREVSKAWTEEEKEKAIEALDQIPEQLWSASIRGILRMDQSRMGKDNPATWADDGNLVIYNSAFHRDPKRPLARVFAHELAHQQFKDLSVDDRNGYLTTSNWFFVGGGKKGRKIVVSRNDGYVSEDGRISPDEDFANNVEYFLFEPSVLKAKVPHIDNRIRQHFGVKFKIGERARK